MQMACLRRVQADKAHRKASQNEKKLSKLLGKSGSLVSSVLMVRRVSRVYRMSRKIKVHADFPSRDGELWMLGSCGHQGCRKFGFCLKGLVRLCLAGSRLNVNICYVLKAFRSRRRKSTFWDNMFLMSEYYQLSLANHKFALPVATLPLML